MLRSLEGSLAFIAARAGSFDFLVWHPGRKLVEEASV
jgi:hypothetical protein